MKGLFLEGLIFNLVPREGNALGKRLAYIRSQELDGLLSELIFEGAYLRFKIDGASLIVVGSIFTVLASFHFVFEGNIPITSPREAYIWRGDLTEGFLRYRFGRHIFAGAYFWNLTGWNLEVWSENGRGKLDFLV